MNQLVKRITTVTNFILIAIPFSAVFILIFISLAPSKTIRLLNIMSGSMEPSIHTGAVVLVKSVPLDTLKKGDIINFSVPDNPNTFTHRIWEIKTDSKQKTFIVKGDANSSPDSNPVLPNQILGKILFSIPFLGYFYFWIKQPMGFILCVILPSIFIIINELFTIKNTIESEVIKKLSKSTTILLFILLSSLIFSQIPTTPTLAYFSSKKIIAGNIFATKSVTPTPTSIPDDHDCHDFDHDFDHDDDRYDNHDDRRDFNKFKNNFRFFLSKYFRRHDFDDIDYEFVYKSRGIEKGIKGKMSPNFDFDREIFFGTCSSSHCTPDPDLDSTATITFTGRYCHRDFHFSRRIRIFY